jgi:hypothetical protein
MVLMGNFHQMEIGPLNYQVILPWAAQLMQAGEFAVHTATENSAVIAHGQEVKFSE